MPDAIATAKTRERKLCNVQFVQFLWNSWKPGKEETPRLVHSDNDSGGESITSELKLFDTWLLGFGVTMALHDVAPLTLATTLFPGSSEGAGMEKFVFVESWKNETQHADCVRDVIDCLSLSPSPSL